MKTNVTNATDDSRWSDRLIVNAIKRFIVVTGGLKIPAELLDRDRYGAEHR